MKVLGNREDIGLAVVMFKGRVKHERESRGAEKCSSPKRGQLFPGKCKSSFPVTPVLLNMMRPPPCHCPLCTCQQALSHGVRTTVHVRKVAVGPPKNVPDTT